jgi:hypothetical protein
MKGFHSSPRRPCPRPLEAGTPPNVTESGRGPCPGPKPLDPALPKQASKLLRRGRPADRAR